jgi:Transposase and inactivated derivatives
MDIEQSNEPRMSGRGDGGALVRVERRRNWSDEEKLAILKETTAPGAIVSAVARRHSVGTGQLYTWRKQLLRGAMAGFVPGGAAQYPPRPSAHRHPDRLLLDGLSPVGKELRADRLRHPRS